MSKQDPTRAHDVRYVHALSETSCSRHTSTAELIESLNYHLNLAIELQETIGLIAARIDERQRIEEERHDERDEQCTVCHDTGISDLTGRECDSPAHRRQT